MKKLFSRVISIFAVFALISCGLISCSDIENNESGSVSFSISPDLAKAVLGAGRSARAETDPPDGVTGDPEEKPYRISVVMSGDKNETQSEEFTEKDWEDISNGGKTAPTFTFNDIRVGSEIVVSATIYYGTGEHLVWPCMTGSSDTVKIMEGENPVSFNVHKLARVNLYNNTESGEIISDISKLDVYALPKGSEVANKILELVAKDDSKNDPEIYEILSAYSKIYSYSKPDSPYLTGGYELKDGAEVYMLSLLYTSDGAVYLGHPDVSSTSETLSEDALTTIEIDEINYIYLKLMKMDFPSPSPSTITAFFPKKFSDRTVAAWYAYYGSDYTEAVFFFNEGEFVTTKHKISSNSGEKRTIQASGEYLLSGTPNDYDNNTGTAQFKDGDDEKVVTITITNGVLNVSEMSSDAYARQSLDALPSPEDETSEDTPHHSAMDFEITLTNSSVPSAELYQVSIFAINESGYSNMSKIGSLSEQEKASVLVETLMDESVGKYLGSYTPTVQNWYDSDGSMLETPETIANPMMTVSEDGATITISDSYTSGAMQANAPTGIVAVVHYGNLSTYSNFFVGLSEKITTSTSSTNNVSMAVAERSIPVQVNFYAGENPNLLSSCVMAVSTWSTDLNELSKNFSNYLKVVAVANHITEKGYSIPQSTITAGQYSTTAMNGIPCFSVKVSATPYLSYDGSCTNYGTDYNLKLSVYAKSESDGIYSVETVSDGSDSDDSVLVSCGTYTIEKGIVSVLETNYRTDFVSTATLYGAYDSKSQTFDSSASSFTLSSGSGVTFTFGEEESDNLDIVFLFETEIDSGKYEELDKLPTLHINADDDIDSIVENYTTQAIMLGYDYNEEKTDSEPEYDKDSKVWIMHIYFDKVEIKEVFSATGQGTSDYITLSEKHSFTLTSYSTLTYEVKYSDGDSITDKVVSKGTWALSDDEKSYIITETEYFDFSDNSALVAVKEPNPQTVSMANLNENGKFSYDSANGVSVMFTVVGDEPETVTIGGVSVTLEKFDTTDLGEKISLSVEKAEDGKSVTITASPDESITVSQYNLILFEEQEQVSLPEGTLDSSTGSYVWTLTENIINNLSAGNHQITVSVIIDDTLYTAITNLTITK